ncbi:hypothetical protein AMATHDRAFT_3301 [Amanita thiersii Skay4041]|uniref:Uncharacterized protein n=1 Tax=Amanita thiersii Skay4041 TaxID=703135 RepID=A0A2A9NTZ2_9AGAR|nr:hypothetical protein AMATHDRAFT_3301 [Amanita thiersii Skay4041]
MRCPELSRLAKPLRPISLTFVARAPGSVEVLLTPFPSRNVVDPTHPAFTSQLERRAFPHFRAPTITLKAYPLALLEKYNWSRTSDLEFRDVANGTEPIEPSLPAPVKLPSALDPISNNSRIEMHLSVATSIRNTSKSAVIRTSIARRVKYAIRLIVTRGAYTKLVTVKRVENGEQKTVKEKIVAFNDKEAEVRGCKWLLNGWMYIFHPTIHLYRMPYQDLIPLLRGALKLIYSRGILLERQWAKARQTPAERKAVELRRNMEKRTQRPSPALLNQHEQTPLKHHNTQIPSKSSPTLGPVPVSLIK